MHSLIGAAAKRFVASLLFFVCVGWLNVPSARSDESPTDKANAAAADQAKTNASDVEKKQQEDMQKQIDAAREAYEKEKRETPSGLKGIRFGALRMNRWPSSRWKTISRAARSNSFCRDQEGNLLVCLAGGGRTMVAAMLGERAFGPRFDREGQP